MPKDLQLYEKRTPGRKFFKSYQNICSVERHLWFSDVSWGYKSGILVENGLISASRDT